MANLEFLTNVTHAGRVFPGPVAGDPSSRGAIVDMNADPTGLSAVAQGLIDRKLARPTNDPATHSSALVGPDGVTVVSVDAPAGTGQVPAAPQAAPQPDGFPQKPAPAPQAQAPQAPAQPQQQAKQPTAEEAAATAAAA